MYESGMTWSEIVDMAREYRVDCPGRKALGQNGMCMEPLVILGVGIGRTVQNALAALTDGGPADVDAAVDSIIRHSKAALCSAYLLGLHSGLTGESYPIATEVSNEAYEGRLDMPEASAQPSLSEMLLTLLGTPPGETPRRRYLTYGEEDGDANDAE